MIDLEAGRIGSYGKSRQKALVIFRITWQSWRNVSGTDPGEMAIEPSRSR